MQRDSLPEWSGCPRRGGRSFAAGIGGGKMDGHGEDRLRGKMVCRTAIGAAGCFAMGTGCAAGCLAAAAAGFLAAALAARRFLGGGIGGAAGLPFAARYRIMEERCVWKGRLSCRRSFS
ncbi:hypothetical protein [Selenomonas bovis]|uniref:hypothetical protein n=1 Tax=Selenomonas bovis TaxID=416586 RepID=UPI000AF43F2B|nr:hypothetical protein [Selenomonas bovis]